MYIHCHTHHYMYVTVCYAQLPFNWLSYFNRISIPFAKTLELCVLINFRGGGIIFSGPLDYFNPIDTLFLLQESGILLSKRWPLESDITGKAVSLLCMQMFFAQFFVAMTMGFLIQYFATHRVTLFVSLCGSALAACSALRITVTPVNTPPTQTSSQ